MPTKVFVAWDCVSSRTASVVADFAYTALPAFDVVGEPPGFGPPDMESVTSDLRDADRILVVWSLENPLFVSFQYGLALALGKPTTSVALDEETRASLVSTRLDLHLASTSDDLWLLLSQQAGVRQKVPRAARRDDTVLLVPPGKENKESRSEVRRAQARDGGSTRPRRRTSARGSSPGVARRGGSSGSSPPTGSISPPGAGVVLNRTWSMPPEPVCTTAARWRRDASRGWRSWPKLGSRPSPYSLRWSVPSNRPHDLRQLVQTSPHEAAPIYVERVELRNFKMFEHLIVEGIGATSLLGGRWTCLAGINGAGKSTVLQAICIALLGPRQATELGGDRLRKMVRRVGADRAPGGAEVAVTVREGSTSHLLVLPLGVSGVEEGDSRLTRAAPVWDRMRSRLVVSYGATRNIADYGDTRWGDLYAPGSRADDALRPLRPGRQRGCPAGRGRHRRPVVSRCPSKPCCFSSIEFSVATMSAWVDPSSTAAVWPSNGRALSSTRWSCRTASGQWCPGWPICARPGTG